MGLVFAVLFLPVALAAVLHILSKREENSRNFEMEKEIIFTKHSATKDNVISMPTKTQDENNKKEAA
jgi:hypothetical protein